MEQLFTRIATIDLLHSFTTPFGWTALSLSCTQIHNAITNDEASRHLRVRYLSLYQHMSSPLESFQWIDYLKLPANQASEEYTADPTVFRLYLVFHPGKKWCLFSDSIIREGSEVLSYTGEVVRSTELTKRRRIYDLHGDNYVLTMNEHSLPLSQKPFVLTTNIDATVFGGLARMANHSCEPSTHLQIKRRTKDQLLGMPVLVASRAISIGEEVTFDYFSCRVTDEDAVEGRKRRIVEETVGTSCLCGASRCRRYLPRGDH